MNAEALIAELSRDLQSVPGVVAIVLGGSRARGTHTLHSDIDLALYYRPDQPLDLARLGNLATAVDDTHRPDLLTGIGGWGPWINGGGWLTVQAAPVDLLYRDLHAVATIMEECVAGCPRIDYQPGHPHGFSTAIYLAEVALCRVLWDPTGAIANLKRATVPYPAALKAGLIRQFYWEADFSLKVAAKAVPRRDVSYVAGSLFRSVSCLMQTLFALSETYCMNEKGAVAIAATFPLAPQRLSERIDEAFSQLAPDADALASAISELEQLVAETSRLLPAVGLAT
jgi:predicted nucleotidyltransferase